jgi:Phosphotransferase enzyme family
MTAGQSDAMGGVHLQTCLREALGGRSVSILARERLKTNVLRLRVEVDGAERPLIVKWSDPVVAHRTGLLARRWLPAVGLEDCGPPLVAVVAAPGGDGAWQVYDDLFGRPLSTDQPVEAEVEAAVEAIARVHTAFAEHALLPEFRVLGGNRGADFYSANVRDGIRALRSLDFDRHRPGAITARDALLERMSDLAQEESERVDLLASVGGPETLLHGDLWPTNAIVLSNGDGVRVRLIDWDEAAAGPSWFDVSTLLLRFDPSHRLWILDAYRRAVDRLADWDIPGDRDLNVIFETSAFARLASLLVWSVAAAADGDSDWLPERLAAMVEWLDAVKPVLRTR